jgi:hypothetical protein
MTMNHHSFCCGLVAIAFTLHLKVCDPQNAILAFPSYGITLFKRITMFCGIDNIPQNILYIQIEYGEYPWTTISPIEHCYEHE